MTNAKQSLDVLRDFIVRLPAIKLTATPSKGIGAGTNENVWWLKFVIDIHHPLAWRVIQELAHVLNLLSLEEPLPTTFRPVSPPPYMNGGPEDFLSWVIECPIGAMAPENVAEWLEGRLPRPVDDPEQWLLEDDESDDVA
jgi:hypothetical protein